MKKLLFYKNTTTQISHNNNNNDNNNNNNNNNKRRHHKTEDSLLFLITYEGHIHNNSDHLLPLRANDHHRTKHFQHTVRVDTHAAV